MEFLVGDARWKMIGEKFVISGRLQTKDGEGRGREKMKDNQKEIQGSRNRQHCRYDKI